MSKISIFEEFYSEESFVDRLKEKGEDGVDVIIPLLNTNELWKRNLYSFYREIPINRLLIGDGGCTDDSIEIALKFPRAKIFKQEHLGALGYKPPAPETVQSWFKKWYNSFGQVKSVSDVAIRAENLSKSYYASQFMNYRTLRESMVQHAEATWREVNQ